MASAEHLARTRLAPLTEKASSWAELHALFWKKGATFKRKGRGLVIMLEGQAVKAGVMGRTFSRVALRKRFGAFEEGIFSRPPDRADMLFACRKDSEAQKEMQCRAWYSERNRLYRFTLSKQLAEIRDW
ncbi:hypothetical protein BG621_07520 [Parasaccharibacter apium]|nr:hypothetical protein BG621_07520 [Parasaccharibacter apium]